MTDRKNALGVLDVLESPYLQVFPIRCIEVRNRNARCGACAAACPTGALAIAEDGMIASDPSLCTGCGVLPALLSHRTPTTANCLNAA